MQKKLYIQLFVLPILRGASTFLRMKDANDVGKDDEAAFAIDYAIERLEAWLLSE